MLVQMRTNRQWNAESHVGTEPNDKLVMFLGAQNDGNNTNITKNIVDTATYLANKQECDADYAEFEAMVYADIGE